MIRYGYYDTSEYDTPDYGITSSNEICNGNMKINNVKTISELMKLKDKEKIIYIEIHFILDELKNISKLILNEFINVEQLFISCCYLNYLPNIDKLTKLRVLVVNYNKLIELPCLDRFTELKILDCSYNKLTYLPSSLSKCVKLNELNCSHNNLMSLPSLELLEQLEQLYCYCNKIKSLPISIICCTKLLKSYYICKFKFKMYKKSDKLPELINLKIEKKYYQPIIKKINKTFLH